MKKKMTRIRIKTDRENKCLIIAIWVLTCIAAKFMLLEMLPEKYSRDGRSIFLQSLTGETRGDKGFDMASRFFSAANKIFHLSSFEAWSVLLGIIGSIILLGFIYGSLQELSLLDFVILTSSVFLMNIYIFTVSKDIIQILMFIPIIYILSNEYKVKTKISIITASLLLIALLMRTYFVLTTVIFLAVYRTFYSSYGQEKKKFWKKMGIIIVIGVLGLFLLRSYAPSVYSQLSQVRSDINQFRIGNDDANTMIVNLIEDDGTVITFMLNLIINVFRLMFPVEMLKEGILQILFFVYQICLSGKILLLFYNHSNETQDENTFISLSLLIAYFIVAAAFEPDFGSAIRHEMVFFPIIYVALFKGEHHVKEQ